MLNKIGIGTVQFGMDYGISNEAGEVSLESIKAILDAAQDAGISLLDTARAYGNSESKLGQVGVDHFDLVTKLVELEKAETDLKDSLSLLGINRVYGVLGHSVTNYFDNPESYKALIACRENGLTDRIGFSLNKTEELDELLARDVDMNLIQIPYNLLDRRFELYFPELKERGVEIHARSAFLQGLFFLPDIKVPSYLNALVERLKRIDQIAQEHDIPKFALALNFVLINPYISKAIVGVTGIDELKQNLSCINHWDKVEELHMELMKLSCDDEDLVLPMNWK